MKKTALRAAAAATVMMLGACSWFQQPAAPVVAGTASGSGTAATGGGAADNPYGAAPYDPNAAGAGVGGNTVYTPPPAAASSGGYVPSYAPVDINAATHTVVRGDTVYNISKRYNITQDNLRAWNNLADNNIGVGQVLRVKPAGYTAPSAPASVPQPVPAPASTPIGSGAVRTVAGITWTRPTAGSIISNFSTATKGVDIAGNAGQTVVAAADGKVVYAGSGLRGYGNLVIVQHNSTYLTAYGHNQSLLVKEGQNVKRGQAIARMGSSDTDRNKLRFEVRQDGKPVNPASYIPL
ncbi:peptidoglycan DD-metalloendopeptidase family protein [Neisseria leonii]|uniref:Peptidoglycan DD-metalloendopeptidase family protein n=1 Tax=Neisseria leonii TaxID=2995413 RepID=A0A9X4IDE0_9NEIS|nr:peptidoglycan DD-metalloendopeptidase family protein [Neisseria sp. 51.81]MDD9327596.1 peptidoglycan DD-metalloendopeptidase family protein [Neisseria sp. 51.81]